MTVRNFRRSAANRDRWMVSYLDVVTILLAFFLCVAAKQLNASKPSPAAVRIAEAAPVPVISPSRSALLQAQAKLSGMGFDLEMQPRGLVVALSNVILFPPGSDTVNQEAIPAIARIATVLRELPNDIQLVGHADSEPIHNGKFHNNWELSTQRSLSILRLLNGYGLSESRLSVASYGVNHPAASNDTADGRAVNRRVEILILDDAPSAAQATSK